MHNSGHSVYFLAIGERALSCLKLAYASLRNAGFLGDIYILTNENNVSFVLDKNTGVCVINSKDLNLNPDKKGVMSTFDIRRLDMSSDRNIRLAKKFTICHAKALADLYIPLDTYDRITYLDVDVLTENRLNDFSKYLENHSDKIITARNRRRWIGQFSIKRMYFAKNSINTNLTALEHILYYFSPPVCADIISVPKKHMNDFFVKWRKECQKGIDSDQGALQAVLLRFFKEVHVLAPDQFFGYGPDKNQYRQNKVVNRSDSVFVHFNGALVEPGAFMTYYQKFLSK